MRADRRRHAPPDLGHRNRLDDVVVGAGFERGGAALLFVVSREHHDVHRGALDALELADDFDAADAGQLEIDDRDVGRRILDARVRLQRVVRGHDLKARGREPAGHLIADRDVVVDDEQANGAGKHGCLTHASVTLHVDHGSITPGNG